MSIKHRLNPNLSLSSWVTVILKAVLIHSDPHYNPNNTRLIILHGSRLQALSDLFWDRSHLISFYVSTSHSPRPTVLKKTIFFLQLKIL